MNEKGLGELPGGHYRCLLEFGGGVAGHRDPYDVRGESADWREQAFGTASASKSWQGKHALMSLPVEKDLLPQVGVGARRTAPSRGGQLAEAIGGRKPPTMGDNSPQSPGRERTGICTPAPRPCSQLRSP